MKMRIIYTKRSFDQWPGFLVTLPNKSNFLSFCKTSNCTNSVEQNPLQSLGYLLLSVNWWKEELLVRSLGSWLDHGKLFCLLFEFLCCSLSSWFSLIFAEFRRRLLCLIRFAHYYYYNHYYYYY